MIVRILALSGSQAGHGHISRMEELSRLLFLEGIEHELFVTHFSESLYYRQLPDVLPDKTAVWVIDARDIDISPFLKSPVIALDNQNLNRKKLAGGTVQFIDTIPHPDAALNTVLARALIAEDIIQLAGRVSPDPSLFVYSGSWSDMESIDRTLQDILSQGIVKKVIRCGRYEPHFDLPENFKYYNSLNREDFIRNLSHSRFLISHFGMTVLEAWYLGNVPLLFMPESGVHKKLAGYLNREINIPVADFSNPESSIIPYLTGEKVWRPSVRPSGDGYTFLMKCIHNYL